MKRFYWFILLILMGCAPSTAVNSPKPTPIGIIAESDSVATPTLVDAGLEVVGSERVEETAVFSTPTPAPSALPSPTETIVAVVTTDIDESVLITQLTTVMASKLQAERGVDTPFAGYQGMMALRLPTDSQLWLVHSVGFRAFDPHFVALLERTEGDWVELGREILEQPDVMQENSVTVVQGNGRLWLEIVTGVGAHGGCYNLLRVDQKRLTSDAAHCSSSPVGNNGLIDFNEDGLLDLILDSTDAYVFCYACSVQYPQFTFRTWTGTEWLQVNFTTLAGDSEAILLNNQAVVLAQAGLWKEASETILLTNTLDPDIVWNQIMINENAQAHLDLIEQNIFPLLQHIFYGDFEAALNEMRPYSVAELFAIAGNPLIIGTPAEGWPDALGDWMIESINPALDVHPEWAAAYFLRGWAAYQIWDEDPTVLTDIENAAILAPNEPLFTESAAFLREE